MKVNFSTTRFLTLWENGAQNACRFPYCEGSDKILANARDDVM